jgi:hypothetical protein
MVERTIPGNPRPAIAGRVDTLKYYRATQWLTVLVFRPLTGKSKGPMSFLVLPLRTLRPLASVTSGREIMSLIALQRLHVDAINFFIASKY